MKTSNRRDFLKKAALAGASALVAPGLLATEEKEVISFSSSPGGETDKFIIPKNNGLKITGTFLDEISHDIPHQNWSEREWEQDIASLLLILLNICLVKDVICHLSTWSICISVWRKNIR